MEWSPPSSPHCRSRVDPHFLGGDFWPHAECIRCGDGSRFYKSQPAKLRWTTEKLLIWALGRGNHQRIAPTCHSRAVSVFVAVMVVIVVVVVGT
jgi:hypothetical protein